MERIVFEGMPASTGSCKGCGLVLVVTDKDSEGTYQTFHQDPMCEWYIKQCQAMGAEQVETKVYEVSTDQTNTLRANSVK